MKSWALAVAAIFLSTTSSAAQNLPPPTPVLPCDSNAITGSRFAPALSVATRSGTTEATDQRPTTISLSTDVDITRYFVDGAMVRLSRLGERAAAAWLANSPGVSIEDCWRSERVAGAYTLTGQRASICQIVIVAESGVPYSAVASARDALRGAGLTSFLLLTPDQTRGVRDDHLPLNPVPVRLEGLSPTMIRITSPPGATEPTIGIANGREWSGTPLEHLGEELTREAIRNNPALSADEIGAHARICVRPDSTISYGDVMRVIVAIRDHGFIRAGLYSEAVVAIDDQGRRR